MTSDPKRAISQDKHTEHSEFDHGAHTLYKLTIFSSFLTTLLIERKMIIQIIKTMEISQRPNLQVLLVINSKTNSTKTISIL